MSYASGPGAKFLTMDDAAIDFAMKYNGISIINKVELGSAIYKFTNGKFSYTIPWGSVEFNEETGERKKSINTMIITVIPKGTIKVADIHTHGEDLNDTQNDNVFSYIDKQNNRGFSELNKKYRSYVVTPNGLMWKYTPWYQGSKHETERIFMHNIPSDPNSRERINTVSPNVIPSVMPNIVSSDINYIIKTVYGKN